MKRFFSLLMAVIMILISASACNNSEPQHQDSLATKGESVGSTLASTTAAATTAKEDEEVFDPNIYYDDRVNVLKITGTDKVSSVEIKDEVVSSNKTGTSQKDTNVLALSQDKKTIIAVGTGTATVVADGQEYPITVSAAPISLVAITGHSLGMGSQGNPRQSVASENGQVYSTYLGHGTSGTTWVGDNISNLSKSGAGLGYSAEYKVENLNALTIAGSGRYGVDGGLAFEWNKLTGEKIWVMNAAYGGSCINEWIVGTEYHNRALRMMNACGALLKKEIAAGHYEFKDYAVIYFSAANFDYKGVDYDNQKLHDWYNSMWNGYQNGLTVDIDGDGNIDKPTSLGFVPHWDSRYGVSYGTDKPHTFYMASSTEYPYAFMASNFIRYLQNANDIAKNFPEIDYNIHAKNETIAKPAQVSELFPDGVHLSQVGYNAYGQDIAKNLYSYLRTENLPGKIEVQSVSNLKDIGDTWNITTSAKRIVIVPENVAASNFTVTTSDNLVYSEPGTIKATERGEGTITISHNGKVIRTIKVIIR